MYVKQLRDVIYDQSDLSDMKDDLMENMQPWLYNCENGLCSGKSFGHDIPYCPGSIRFHSNNVPTTLSHQDQQMHVYWWKLELENQWHDTPCINTKW